ncbi:tyrosine-protein phosphatase [Herbidospora yilanensis]|uniref:tyrosine-protein phosphatase n=1 Tax=Herbidospora yilanensis TaxID=354426 RepID=UPI000780BBFC|nr:tyrosine-protein phosphatase [Herbidospora yilanensis]
MNENGRWIVLEGAVNVRDLGGLPTVDGGVTRSGRVLRGDNLQSLTPADVNLLVAELKLRHVIDLRSNTEVRLEGPGPLTGEAAVEIHHHTLFAEGGLFTDAASDDPDEAEIDERALPWADAERLDPELRVTGHYYGYLRDRPDSVVAALRVMAHGDGAALVHCAAGKDRTGVLCALAQEIAGVTREAIVADYVATGERIAAILERLRSSDTYRVDLDSKPADSHVPRAEYIEHFLDILDTRYGGPMGWLAEHAWTGDDTAALRARLRD